jgi:hypothetical protein
MVCCTKDSCHAVAFKFRWTHRASIKQPGRTAVPPITVAARSKAWTVFARSNTGIMGSNPTQAMDVCMRLFCVCDVLCEGSGLATGSSPVQGVPPTVYRLRNWKSDEDPKKGCRAIAFPGALWRPASWSWICTVICSKTVLMLLPWQLLELASSPELWTRI